MAKKNGTGKKSSPPSATGGINIGISEKDRGAIAGGLARLLADTYTLYLTTHNFHWNVTGPMFNTLHTMFMAQYTELWTAVDPIAERIRSLSQEVSQGLGLERGIEEARRCLHCDRQQVETVKPQKVRHLNLHNLL
jgi:starvation-inducible DNA-binding protein